MSNNKFFCYYLSNKTFFVSKLFNKFNVPLKLRKKFNIWRHRHINNYLYEEYKVIINTYAKKESSNMPIKENERKIWVFWWQGLDDAPELIKTCIKSMEINMEEQEIIILTKENLEYYIESSTYMYELVIQGTISLTHFSDLVRFRLLSKYGGIWLDATIYVSSKVETSYLLNEVITSSGYLDESYFNVSLGRWTGFFIGGNPSNDFFSFVDNFFEEYWKKETILIDYFLIDYIINIAYQHNIGGIREIFLQYEGDNPNMFELQKLINEPFVKEKYLRLVSDTQLFKMSHKGKKSSEGNTYYSYLIDQYKKR